MIEADDSRQFPAAGCLLPDVDELVDAAVFSAFGEIAEPVLAGLDCPVPGDRVHRHRSRHQLPLYLSAAGEIRPAGLEVLFIIGQPTLVMIKLQVGGEHRLELVEIATVDCGEECRIHRRNLSVQLVFVRLVGSRSICENEWRKEEERFHWMSLVWSVALAEVQRAQL